MRSDRNGAFVDEQKNGGLLMSLSKTPIAHIYNPQNQTRQALLDAFVVREKEFTKIFGILKNSELSQILC